MANEYRDLTKDDVLQAGDVFDYLGDERPIFTIWIGEKAGQYRHKFRRPINPAEITAAARVKYEKAFPKHFHERRKDGQYKHAEERRDWYVWCTALAIDPTADVKGDK